MSSDNSNRLDLGKALVWILLSTILISGSAAMCLLYFQHIREMRGQDKKYNIIAIVQTGPEKEALKTVYLAELLDLSIDSPTNLYRFNSVEARQKLLASPLIKDAEVKKIIPGTLYIDYTVRKPVAFLTDYSNTVFDSEGRLFPFKPFFTPKKLPEIALGLSLNRNNPQKSIWGMQLRGPRTDLALTLLEFLSANCCSESCQLKRIDVSKAYSPSYGQRQIIVVLEDRVEIEKDGRSLLVTYPRMLRLSTEGYVKELADYVVLRSYMIEQEKKALALAEGEAIVKAPIKIIDLRIPSLAFIKG